MVRTAVAKKARQDTRIRKRQSVSGAMFESPLAEDLDTMREEARHKPYWGYEPPRRLIYDCLQARVIQGTNGETRVSCPHAKLSPRSKDGSVGLATVLRGAAMPACQDCDWYDDEDPPNG